MQRCLGCMREFGEEFDVCPHCGYIVGTAAASKNHLAPGSVLQERYILGKALGQGGFGITYIAWDNRIGRAVAIKEYMPNALASRMTGEKEISCYNEEARRQFDLGLAKTRKEAHALSQFGALESVVKVHDCIEENGTAYIVMELLRGRTVKEIIAERGRLSFAETMRVMTPVLQTLDAMHKVGMIHRDVSPDNIFVCEDGKIKLLDFGAARVVSGTDEKTLSVMLKAGYAPVEQYSTKAKQGPYTDVYAASATIYKMLTGETPISGLDRLGDPYMEPVSQGNQTVPPTVDGVLVKGMKVSADERIQTADQLLQILQKILQTEQEKAYARKHAGDFRNPFSLKDTVRRFWNWFQTEIERAFLYETDDEDADAECEYEEETGQAQTPEPETKDAWGQGAVQRKSPAAWESVQQFPDWLRSEISIEFPTDGNAYNTVNADYAEMKNTGQRQMSESETDISPEEGFSILNSFWNEETGHGFPGWLRSEISTDFSVENDSDSLAGAESAETEETGQEQMPEPKTDRLQEQGPSVRDLLEIEEPDRRLPDWLRRKLDAAFAEVDEDKGRSKG